MENTQADPPKWLVGLLVKIATRNPDSISGREAKKQLDKILPTMLAVNAAIPDKETVAGIDNFVPGGFGAAMRTALTGPFKTDTLDNLYTNKPVYGSGKPKGYAGYVSNKEPHRVKLDRGYLGSMKVPVQEIEEVLLHETQHSAELTGDTAANRLSKEILNDWDRHVTTRKSLQGKSLTPSLRMAVDMSTDNMELNAYAIENAMNLIRNKATLEEVKQADEVLPGIARAYNFIQEKLRKSVSK